jgi:pSer/pThr/pTyr-binding forkhead associated (FHA) protein
MLVCFDELNGLSEGFALDLDQLPATFGRDADATVHLTNLLVSRHHCEIAVADHRVVVRDLGSMNGTLLNGEAVDESPLAEGDTLQIGLQSFVISSLQSLLLEQAHVAHTESSCEVVAI